MDGPNVTGNLGGNVQEPTSENALDGFTNIVVANGQSSFNYISRRSKTFGVSPELAA
jgi:hypothetical protein